jgi:curli production assembly/transport component CsgG
MKRLLLFSILSLSACGANQMHPLQEVVSEPQIAAETEIQKTLKSMPSAKTRIVAAVYNFTDKTGQQKPGESAQYSKAVTQGPEEILKKALLDAADHQWFRVVERQGLDALLQERKIINSTRQAFAQEEAGLDSVGPLLYSGMLLEGGVVSYDSNVVTGGAGARYLGLGVNSEYRRDVVTVYLSGVSVKTGEVVVSVSTSKTILSTAVSGGLFKFVSFDELLEAEAGLSINEPPQFAVRQAIELAVYSLIMEGYQRGLWQFNNPDAGTAAYLDYLKKKGGGKVEQAEIDRARKLAGNANRFNPSNYQENKFSSNEPSNNNTPSYNAPVNNFASSAPAVSAQVMPAVLRQSSTPSVSQSSRPAVTPAPAVNQSSSQDVEEHFLQVATFPRASASKGLVEKITAAGYPVRLHQKKSAYGETYAVLVGPFSSQEEAQNIHQDLSKLVASNTRSY